MQEELEYTLKRIEQLQRGGGAYTPVRRRTPVGGPSGVSKNPSPYNRNTSGGKKVNTPGSSVGSASRTNNPYTRPGISGSRIAVGSISNLNS